MSEAQADALAARDAPFAAEHRASMAIAWDARRRTPRDLREAVHYARQAWRAEIPPRMSQGPAAIADDGAIRMDPEAEHFVFDPADRLEEDDDRQFIGFRVTPFRATLAAFERGDEKLRRQAAIVRKVAAGERPVAAAIAEGVPLWAAGDVAELALRAVLGQLTDVVVSPA